MFIPALLPKYFNTFLLFYCLTFYFMSIPNSMYAFLYLDQGDVTYLGRYVGEDVTMSCDLTLVQWRFNGRKLPERVQKYDYDRSLYISNLTFEDRGTYICTGQNSEGILSYAFKILLVFSKL